MAGNTWYKLGDIANDQTGDLYYRGQRIREAYYRGEQIWGEEFLGILLARLPDKLHYPGGEGLTGIDITRLPDKTEYEHGKEFDYSGAVVMANYTDGSTIDITSQCTFIPVTDVLSGNANVHTSVLNVENEPLDYTGIKVLGIWSHGRTEDITDECVFDPLEGTIIDKSSIMTGIIITRLPNKTTYSAGEVFDFAGTMVVAVYADGHTCDITSECSFAPEKPVQLVGIHVTKMPIGTDENPYDGIEVTAYYSNGRFADVTSECVLTLA